MFQYAVAKSIAVRNNDLLKVDISDFGSYSLHNGYRLNLFNIDENIATNADITALKGRTTFLFKVLKRLGIYNVKTSYREKEITLFDDNIYNFSDVYLDGYWQNELYFQDIRDILLTEFTLKDGISKSLISTQEQIENSESVSIHVRRGDYLNHPDVGVLDVDYYKRAVKLIAERVKSPTFFVFSNDIQWCKDNFTFIDKCHFLEEGGTELDDMALMSKCSHNIIANSSFSWWGAWLNNKSNRIIIAPKKWMAIN
ncbi:MAG: alpha-1,2-fucosyltransferase, partial [Endozoicomonadaceae bacterium]|nr:alpha-1,2-fucosyltransferase [Endozoicomonadaceae bacterium]